MHLSPRSEGLSAEGRGSSTEETYRTIREKLRPRISELARCNSTGALEALTLYPSLEPLVREVLGHADVGDFSHSPAPARPQYRFVAWNLERGIHYNGQLEALRSDPYLREADSLLSQPGQRGGRRT